MICKVYARSRSRLICNHCACLVPLTARSGNDKSHWLIQHALECVGRSVSTDEPRFLQSGWELLPYELEQITVTLCPPQPVWR